MKAPKNENYSAQIVEIKTVRPLENCDKVQAAIIMGNQVIVSNNVKVGDVGIYFPVECQLSAPYLEYNNLYRKAESNSDKTSKGYFDENGRIKSIKFRSLHKSEGLFMPIESLGFIKTKEKLSVNTIFDELEGIEICKKYKIKTRVTNPSVSKSKKLAKKHENKLIEDQFRLHYDTSMLYRNLHHIYPDSILSCTTKLHGCVSADTIINTDKGDFTIQYIVENKLNVKIKAFDIELNEIVYVPIDEYYFLPDDGEWLEIELEDGTKLEITTNNPVWLPELSCYRKAELLKVGDELLIG